MNNSTAFMKIGEQEMWDIDKSYLMPICSGKCLHGQWQLTATVSVKFVGLPAAYDDCTDQRRGCCTNVFSMFSFVIDSLISVVEFPDHSHSSLCQYDKCYL